MEDLSVELEHTIQAAEILNDSRIEYVDIVHNNDCGSVTRVQGKVDEFISLYQHESVIAFTDGAVTENGKGSSACILIPLEVGDSVIKASQVQCYDMQFGSRNGSYRLCYGVCSRVLHSHRTQKAKGKDVYTNGLQDCHKLLHTKDSNASLSRNNVPN